MKKVKHCLACNKELVGRSDKRFCDIHCKSAYHYKKSVEETPKFFYMVDKQLRVNRKILKQYNKAGKATVRCKKLLNEGFNPKFFTHYWKNQKGDVYLFVYEYGFLKRIENNVEKYILIQWQEYMNS